MIRTLALSVFIFLSSFIAKAEEFTSQTIDIGIVVSDVEKAVDFYTKALGFKEKNGFSVSSEFCKKAGLTDGHELKIRVLTLGDEEKATKIKLMQLPQTNPKKSDNQFVHSQLGVSYLTVFVKDTNKAIERLKEYNSKPVADGPVSLPPPLPSTVFITLVRDPDGNFIELVGPKP